MSYNIIATPHFVLQAKRLSKHYASFSGELKALIADMQVNPLIGADLGNGIHKIRMRVASKGKGKSGGVRVITCVRIIANKVYLLSVYDKANIETLTDKEIIRLAAQYI